MEGNFPEVKVSPAVFCQVPERAYFVPTNLKVVPVVKLVRPKQW